MSGEGCGPQQCLEAQVGRVGIRMSQPVSKIACATQDTPELHSTGNGVGLLDGGACRTVTPSSILGPLLSQ